MKLPFSGSYRLTQGFGLHPEWYAVFGMRGHNGLDYGIPTGTPILAPFSGKVIESASDPTGYGNYLKIESNTYGTILGHLQRATVTVGQQVITGAIVGYSDNTGNSTGPHLHWGVYPIPRDRGNGYSGCIDQTSLIGVAEPTPPVTGGDDVNYQPQIDELTKDLRNVEKLQGTIAKSIEALNLATKDDLTKIGGELLLKLSDNNSRQDRAMADMQDLLYRHIEAKIEQLEKDFTDAGSVVGTLPSGKGFGSRLIKWLDTLPL